MNDKGAGWSQVTRLGREGQIPGESEVAVALLGQPRHLMGSTNALSVLQKGVAAMTNGKAKILVIDDDELTIDLLNFVLGLSGYHITPALTMTEGLHLACAGNFDVYVLDSLLPDGNGREVCLKIREFDQRTPIVFCSGDASTRARQQALAAGAQVYLVKPIDTQELERLLAGFMNGNGKQD
jgi:CheY-like chemotaxis protein